MPRRMSPEEKREAALKDRSSKLLNFTTDPLKRLRLQCLQKYGTTAILRLCNAIRKAAQEAQGTKTKTFTILQRAMKDIALPMEDKELKEVFEKLEPQGSDPINCQQLLDAVRPIMSSSRRRLVEAAFRKMDSTGTGIIDDTDLRNRYNVTNHQNFLNGDVSGEDIINKFVNNFKGSTFTPGKITLEEFMDFYAGICVALDDDRFFDLMMRNCYKL